MIDAARCILSELLVTECACHKCKPGGGTADVKPARTARGDGFGRAFPAQYAGTCCECRNGFRRDDPIRARTIGYGYAHEECTT